MISLEPVIRLWVTRISRAGASRKSASRASMIVRLEKIPKMGRKVKVPVTPVKKPTDRIKEVINMARPVPSMVCWIPL